LAHFERRLDVMSKSFFGAFFEKELLSVAIIFLRFLPQFRLLSCD